MFSPLGLSVNGSEILCQLPLLFGRQKLWSYVRDPILLLDGMLFVEIVLQPWYGLSLAQGRLVFVENPRPLDLVFNGRNGL